jgi:hypothetical protein
MTSTARCLTLRDPNSHQKDLLMPWSQSGNHTDSSDVFVALTTPSLTIAFSPFSRLSRAHWRNAL